MVMHDEDHGNLFKKCKVVQSVYIFNRSCFIVLNFF